MEFQDEKSMHKVSETEKKNKKVILKIERETGELDCSEGRRKYSNLLESFKVIWKFVANKKFEYNFIFCRHWNYLYVKPSKGMI